ncbi:MAG: hypothetical protein K6F53_07315 [Lachnospiraceae bacterium]|nr:hypothetical protein [Lachnospiraceae bacterium]
MHEHEQRLTTNIDVFREKEKQDSLLESKDFKQPEALSEEREILGGKKKELSIDELLDRVQANMPQSYGELLRSKRVFWSDSKDMDLVKKTMRLLGAAVMPQGMEKVYTAEELDGVIKLYNDAIDACNFYVNNPKKDKSNRRYGLVKENLTRLTDELATLDRVKDRIESGESDGKADSVLTLIRREKERVTDKERQRPQKENKRKPVEKAQLREGAGYTLFLDEKYSFRGDSSFGNSATLSIRSRESILKEIPNDLTSFDKDVREEYEMIRDWAKSEPLKGEWRKEIRELSEKESQSGLLIYQNFDRLKASKEKKIREMAVKLETMMKGQLDVDLDDKNTVDFSDREDLFTEPFDGSRQHKMRDIAGMTDRKDEPLFLHEPCIADIRQGDVGNCYYMSALAILVERDPDYIRKNIKDLGDRVAVRFGNFGNPKTVIVRKSTMRAADKNRDVGAHEAPLWVRMMEKAYAIVLAGWVKGCDGNQRIAALSQIQNIRDKRTDEMFSLIKTGNPYNALDAGGKAEDFISFFTGKKMSAEIDLTGFHKAAVSLDSLAKSAREKMNPEDVPALHRYYDGKIKEWVDRVFTRTRVKTYSEYMDALDEAEERLKDKKMTLDDYPAEGVTEKDKKEGFLNYIKSLRKLVKQDNRIVQVDHSLTGEGAYSKAEIEVFRRLENADKQKKFVSVHVRQSHKFARRTEENRNVSESESDGMYSKHEYAFLGVRRLKENGRERLFVMLRNPWGDKVRMYGKDARAKLKSNTKDSEEELREYTVNGTKVRLRKEHTDTNGVFHMELRDFLNMAQQYHIEK